MKTWLIFYSWQSDLKKNFNLNEIRNKLKKISDVMNKANDDYNIKIDESTRDTPGSPDIPNTIFEKIKSSDIFISDISFITDNKTIKQSPNPNVLIELGYAVGILGWDRIILLFNESYGDLIDLPFDVGKQRISTFKKNSIEDDNKLEGSLKNGIKTIIKYNPIKQKDKNNFSPEEKKYNDDIYILKLLFSLINMPTIDYFIEKAPYIIISDIFFYWEGFNSFINSSSYHLYDEIANKLILEFYNDWEYILSYGHKYINNGNSFYICDNKNFDQNEYNELEKKVTYFKINYDKLLKYIRNKYIEIDLNFLSKNAKLDYINFHKE
jgi:hypothetical protein